MQFLHHFYNVLMVLGLHSAVQISELRFPRSCAKIVLGLRV